MKKQEISFLSFLGSDVSRKAIESAGNKQMVFDWDKASKIIKDRLTLHKDLIAEAGLQGDWEYTGGSIFEDGKPINDSYTYLSSNWATPTIILSWDGKEQEEIDCFCFQEGSRFINKSKWDERSLEILGISI